MESKYLLAPVKFRKLCQVHERDIILYPVLPSIIPPRHHRYHTTHSSLLSALEWILTNDREDPDLEIDRWGRSRRHWALEVGLLKEKFAQLRGYCIESCTFMRQLVDSSLNCDVRFGWSQEV